MVYLPFEQCSLLGWGGLDVTLDNFGEGQVAVPMVYLVAWLLEDTMDQGQHYPKWACSSPLAARMSALEPEVWKGWPKFVGCLLRCDHQGVALQALYHVVAFGIVESIEL